MRPITKILALLFFTSCLVVGLASFAGEVKLEFDSSQRRPQIEEGSRGRKRII